MDSNAKKKLHAFTIKTFPEQLKWLMENGVRPEDDIDNTLSDLRTYRWDRDNLAVVLTAKMKRLNNRRGKSFDDKSVLSSVKKDIDAWLNGTHACSRKMLSLLEAVFFGTNGNLNCLRAPFINVATACLGRNMNRHGHADYGKTVTDEDHDDGRLRDIYDFDMFAYDGNILNGDGNIGFDQFYQWWSAYKKGFKYSEKYIDGSGYEPFAVTGLFPVPEEWASMFIKYETDEKRLTGDMIAAASCTEQNRYWYFSGISSNRKITNDVMSGHLASVLGYSIFHWIVENRRVLERTDVIMVAEGATPQGEHLLRNFGFKEIIELRKEKDSPRFKKNMNLKDIVHRLIRDKIISRSHSLQLEIANKFGNIDGIWTDDNG